MPRVSIGVPLHKAEVSAATSMSILSAHSAVHQVQYQILGLSLLAKCFNELFITSWRKGFDYFVMLHSDIGVGTPPAASSWVDVLVQRCIDLNAAAVSCIVPIKSDHGHTSTALEISKDNPHNMRRLTVREIANLPSDHINRDDLCDAFKIDRGAAGAMLINTGCLIMNLRKFDWTQWDGFHIDDSIAWNQSRVPASYCHPEDWNLSRFMYRNGWPYYATRELVIDHHGGLPYRNRGGWGKATDTQCGQIHPDEYRKTK